MIVLPRSEGPIRDFPEMTPDELESEWRKAKEFFDQALVQKTEAARIYVAAATRLNTLDRLVKRAEQRAALARREAAKLVLQTA
jgi:hypothetical protein